MKKLTRILARILRSLAEPFTVVSRLRKLESWLSGVEESFVTVIGRPRYVASDDAGFNYQQGRKQIFADIVKAIKFDAFVETGTFFGDTTGFMHDQTGIAVYTCEVNLRYHLVAKMRLAGFPGITLEHSDSRRFLRSLAQSRLSTQVVFFYLDAHWYKDLPLKDEVDIIAASWEHFVIMVDDFKVPGDDGYLYDRYGFRKALSLDLVAAPIEAHGLRSFFPALHSSDETGAKKGCVVLTRGSLSNTISQLPSLREGSGTRKPLA
jgi:hypothetical protein